MISFQVDDLLARMEAFKKVGARILSGPIDRCTKLHGAVRSFTAESPDGVMVELFEQR
jgi:hypothetical protein